MLTRTTNNSKLSILYTLLFIIMEAMKSKKGIKLIETVAVLALLLLFLAVYSGAWTKLFGKSASSLNEQIDLAGDHDKDIVANFQDKCPCVSGDLDNKGCPSGYKITDTGTGNEDRVCLTKKT